MVEETLPPASLAPYNGRLTLWEGKSLWLPLACTTDPLMPPPCHTKTRNSYRARRRARCASSPNICTRSRSFARKESGTRSSCSGRRASKPARSEEHTSELQSPCNLVCRLLLEKKKKTPRPLVEPTTPRPPLSSRLSDEI